MSHCLITGLGLLTPLGDSPDQTWQSLLAGKAISDHSKIPNITGPNRCAQIARAAADQAVSSAGWSRDILSDDRTALIVATSKGPIEDWLGGRLHPSGVAQIAASVAQEIGLRAGPSITLSAACATGLHALIRAAMGIAAGEFDRALVVAAEASVHPLFIGSFARLGVLPPVGHGCRPFDVTRRGFLMSESAAAICLQPDGRPLARLERFAMAGDASHLTAGDPTGQALRKILTRVIDHRPVDLVHAHATGTIQHDPVELAALESVLFPPLPVLRRFPQDGVGVLAEHPKDLTAATPILYSHKAALGHSLGAAGLVSVVLNCLAHRTGVIPGNVNTTQPLQTRLTINREPQTRPIQTSIATATGFGGALAAIALST